MISQKDHADHHYHLLLHDVSADHHDLPEHAGLLLQGRLDCNSQNYLIDIVDAWLLDADCDTVEVRMPL